MSRNRRDVIDLDKETIRFLFDYCLRIKGWSRQDLADALGISKQAVSNALMHPFTLEKASTWCAVLEYPLEDFLAGIQYSDTNALVELKKKVKLLEEGMKEIREILSQAR